MRSEPRGSERESEMECAEHACRRPSHTFGRRPRRLRNAPRVDKSCSATGGGRRPRGEARGGGGTRNCARTHMLECARTASAATRPSTGTAPAVRNCIRFYTRHDASVAKIDNGDPIFGICRGRRATSIR